MEDTAPAPDHAGLVRAIERGDSAAEAELFARFGQRVLYFARRELRSPEQAEDARSETFLRVLQAIRGGTLRSADALPSFVLQTTRYVVYEMVRQRTRAPEGVDPAALDAHEAPAADEPVDPVVIESVRDAIHELAPRDREFLKMYYYDERSKDEIAARLGIDAERVRLIKSRALQRFRAAYGRRSAAS